MLTYTYLLTHADTAVVDSVVDESSYSYVRSEPKIFAQGIYLLARIHSLTHLLAHILTHSAFEHLHLSPEILLLVSNDSFQLRSFNQKEIIIGNKINKNSVQGSLLTHSLTHSSYSLTHYYHYKGHLSTELSLDINEFDDYVYVKVGNETEESKQQSLVLMVKEFRAFLGLCEVLDSPDFVFYFHQPTYPVKLCCSIAGSVNVSLVLATLQIGRNFSNTQAATAAADTSHVGAEGDTTEMTMNENDNQYATRDSDDDDAAGTGVEAHGSAHNTQESRTEAVNTLLSIGSGKLIGARGINKKREPKYYGTHDDDDEEEEL